jgi:hypothetical protein
MRNEAMTRNRESGVALLSAILVLMLMSALLVGFIAMVNADQSASGINRDQTQAYAAAHAGVEKLTADLGQLFQGNFAPTNAQVNTLWQDADDPPALPGISYLTPNGNPGYRISFTDVNPADGSPDIENFPTGTTITSGPYEGLVGLITPYTIEVTARTRGNAEVRMRREMQTVGIPVFQFGIFSENDLSFFAGPNFDFGGRVHSNQHLWLKQDGTAGDPNAATLTLRDRVTAVGEIIRDRLANGANSHHGFVRIARAPGCTPTPPAAPAPDPCRNMTENEGSASGVDMLPIEPGWTNISTGFYNNWVRNRRTGARTLSLPLVSNGATPIDIIRRPALLPTPFEDPASSLGQQRFYNLATLRILLSDRAADLTGVPGAVGTPIRLANPTVAYPAPGVPAFTISATEAGVAGSLPAGTYNFAESTGVAADGFRTVAGTSSIDGYILINRQNKNGLWTDVTKEVLNLGFAGRRLSSTGSSTGTPAYAGLLDTPDMNNACPEPHPNAIIRLQRIKDTFNGSPTVGAAAGLNGCGAVVSTGPNRPTTAATDFWPNVLYDPREGMLRDDQGQRPVAPAGVTNITSGDPRMYWGGVMHYVELDVNNLKRWLEGTIGSSNTGCNVATPAATCPMDVTGFVLYFSDRRLNRNLGSDNAADAPAVDATTGELVFPNDVETGEFGFEDIVNRAVADGRPSNLTNGTPAATDGPFTDVQGVQRWAEDVNGNGTIETYGGVPRLLPAARMLNIASPMTPVGQGVAANFTLYGSPALPSGPGWGVAIDRNTARVNRAFFFRRALKLVNGGRGNLPARGSQGLTVAAENPVYVQGHYNACSNALPTVANAGSPVCATAGAGFDNTHVSAAIIADAVTLLSGAFNDIKTFRNPHEAGREASPASLTNNLADPRSRQANDTWYRMGIIAGKGLNFQHPGNNGNDHTDYGTDGGAHNFLRYIERWAQDLNYRGSILSFYTSRQAVGTYKCCDIVYSPPIRGYNFDTEFLTPTLLPPRTPMFRDLNTLTFRQVLRPTQ